MHRPNKSHVAFLLTAITGVFLLGGGCPPPPLVDETVTVAGAGGAGEVTFNGTAGQAIRITLTATPATMEPYGILRPPTGAAIDAPPIGTSTNGTDQYTGALPVTGQYSYDVFDGSNTGGRIAVRVELTTAPPY